MAALSTPLLELTDGSRVAVIGGGPAGSFFSYYALEYARRFGLEIELDIYEAKDLAKIGAAGCNHCGGIVSESLVQELATDGIIIPSEVIQRGINTYTMHTEQGTRVICAPSEEQRIASVFRGCGPRGCLDKSIRGFDNYLLGLCREKGAQVIAAKVNSLERTEDGIFVGYSKSLPKQYDLVVGAAGLNNKTLELFKGICPSYLPPETTRTYISEFMMKPADIKNSFGDSMHVFLLDLPRITFGALIPKENYVTLVLLGKDIDQNVVQSFLNSEEVRSCFPPDFPIERTMPCKCYPYINVKKGIHAYADRVVLIGDSASSKLYKNGIGAAFATGKAAASTAIFEGVGETQFEKYYAPICRDLDRDNTVGKFIFWVTRVIQKSPMLKRGVLDLVGREQASQNSAFRMSSALWDTFTGSAGYRNILRRFLHPGLLTGLTTSIIRSNVPTFNRQDYEEQEARQTL
jgi:flavin-dependent dehydrogenase